MGLAACRLCDLGQTGYKLAKPQFPYVLNRANTRPFLTSGV